MRFCPTRPALVLSAVVAALALSLAPAVAVSLGTGVAGHDAGTHHSIAGDRGSDSPAVARIDPRDPSVERAHKHRLALAAIVTVLLALPALAVRGRSGDVPLGHRGAATPSPILGRAPPAPAALCT